MTYFNWHNWPYTLCKDSKEVDLFLESNKVKGKRIKAVSSIGMAENMEKWRREQTVNRILLEAGIPEDTVFSTDCPFRDTAKVSCSATLCEPFILIFDDDSTLEIMPVEGRYLRLCVNGISTDIVDGVNEQNYQPGMLFNALVGESINEIAVLRRSVNRKSGSYDYSEERGNITFQFHMSGDFGIGFCQSWNGWYVASILNQRHFLDLGNATHTITFCEFNKAAKDVEQINIVEGHDSSSYFWIMPVRRLGEHEREGYDSVDEYRDEEISIEEEDVSGFLYYFLAKYFDKSIDYDGIRDEYTGNGFEWNLEYNLYTKETMRIMIEDIRRCSELLITNFDAEDIRGLIASFHYYDFETYEEKQNFNERPDDAAKIDIIRRNVKKAVSFYDRFTYRMEAMLEHCPVEYDWISFMGP